MPDSEEELIAFIRRYYEAREKADAFFFECMKEQIEWFIQEFGRNNET
jgi:hypothetical protein